VSSLSEDASVSEDVASASKSIPRRARAETRRLADVDVAHASCGSSSCAPSAGEPEPDRRLSTAPIATGEHGRGGGNAAARAPRPPGLRRLVSDGRQRPGRIRLGAASADGRAWTRHGATVGRGRARRGMALVVTRAETLHMGHIF
jgi:hypothetical protein